MPALDTLPDDHAEIALLLTAALHGIFEKHVVPHVSRSDGFTSNTNRVGETFFRYMCAACDKNQNTRIVTRVSTRLAFKECNSMTYCMLPLEHLLEY